MADLSSLKDIKNNTIAKRHISKDRKPYPNQTKDSLDLTNYSSYRKEKNKIFKFNNFNDIYDNLINIKDLKNKLKNHSENVNKRKKLIILTNISKNKNNKNNKNENLQKKQRNYFKCNLFRNLNKLTFENTISYKKKISNKNNNKICKNISFSYYNKNFIHNFNNNNIKSLNILNEIMNIQRNIIIQQKEKEKKLKEEINIRMNEINKFKFACLNFLYSLNKEKNIYKKFIEIQSQLFKENIILKQIILSNKLFIFKTDSNKINEIQNYFEKEKRNNNEKYKNKIIIPNNKEKYELIYKMLNREKFIDDILLKLSNNSYDYIKNNTTFSNNIKINKYEINNKINLNRRKKLYYLINKKK